MQIKKCEQEIIKFGVWLTGHEQKDIEQMLNDYNNYKDNKSNLVEARVSPTEPTFATAEVLKLVREEITESYFNEMDRNDFEQKLYTILGIITCALKRGEVRR